MQPIIELKNISFIAQNETIIQDFSYTFPEGMATAIAGPSGCGKSTTLKLAAGLLVPTRGEVLYRGLDVNAMNRLQNQNFRRESAMVFQDSALWANQDIYNILQLPLQLHFPELGQRKWDARIKEVIAEVGYKKALDIRPAKLSMGEKKLIGFARALLCKPSLFFLDEWTESLDEEGSRQLNHIVAAMKKTGHTIIFVCHDLSLIRSIADFVVMMYDGKKTMEFSGYQITEDALGANLIERGLNSCDSEYAMLIR